MKGIKAPERPIMRSHSPLPRTVLLSGRTDLNAFLCLPPCLEFHIDSRLDRSRKCSLIPSDSSYPFLPIYFLSLFLVFWLFVIIA